MLLLALLLTLLDAPTTQPAAEPATRPATVQVEEGDPESSLPVVAATDTDALKALDGQRVFVDGVVSSARWSRSGKVMNINFEDVGDGGFLAALFEKRRAAFDEAFDGDLSAALEGKRVRLEGPVQVYDGPVNFLKDRPQIILNQTSQITILDDDEPAEEVEEAEDVDDEVEAPAVEEEVPGLKLRDD